MTNSVNFKVILSDAVSSGVKSITAAFSKLRGDVKGTTGVHRFRSSTPSGHP